MRLYVCVCARVYVQVRHPHKIQNTYHFGSISYIWNNFDPPVAPQDAYLAAGYSLLSRVRCAVPLRRVPQQDIQGAFLSVGRCLLSPACCLLPAVCCLLSPACCLLSAVCCLLSPVCCRELGVRSLLYKYYNLTANVPSY
jgi:hypothetical protein